MNRFAQAHKFQKPNDLDALLLMNASAVAVVEDLGDIVFAYGVSDEYRYAFIMKISGSYGADYRAKILMRTMFISTLFFFFWVEEYQNVQRSM